ncbi:cyclic nucleotide-binding domain-containing protein 2-like [Saccostrea echinata]|uniref:cyclic nucleotide-binding domain-containing protein 2-like n=1 Tax=Saccostrea echinata TaxID=191078 RepID=UPI002A832ACD|nr:cyclic nucleotide-binding domain-containing protein 2-like [Saccostrea echinata]
MSEPPETDLDYYSRPENYTGSNLQSLQKFTLAKQKQDKALSDQNVKAKKKKSGFDLFARYKHILKGYISDEEEEEEDEEEEKDEGAEEAKEDSSKKTKFEDIKEESEEIQEDEYDKEKKDVKEKDDQTVSPSGDKPSKSPAESRRRSSASPFPPGFEPTPSPRDSVTSTSPVPPKPRGQQDVSGGRSSVSLRFTKQQQIAKELRANALREKFRKAIFWVKIALKFSSSASGSDPGEGMKTFMDISSEVESSNLKSSGLSFDPNYFKANKEINLSTEVKGILSLPSEQRTPEQVQTAMFGLQIMRSFAEYPLHMQEKLAKVAYFEVVPPKRIIIRQGHFAENFYFIVSGQAVVTLLLRDPKTGASFVKTATIMRRGMSFGELALLHHSRRTATVTSQGEVQLLSVGRVDFFDIFMSGAGPGEIPDHIKFISTCDFMKDWPLEQLLENPQHCLLHFFKRNVVIVRDSTNSEWLYVVKSGFCQVLKQLKGVTPKIGWKEKSNQSKIELPTLETPLPGPKVDTWRRKRRKTKSAGDERRLENQENLEPAPVPQAIPGPSTKKFSKAEYSLNPVTKKAHLSPIKMSKYDTKKKYEVPEKCKPPKPKEPPKDLPPSKPPPVFVQVGSLKPKDVFGLETIQFEDSIENPQTVVTLVSRGAECIMLNKEFFAKHANEQVKKLIRHQVRPYPDEKTFQNNLQIKENWELYKKSLIDDLTS